MFTVYVTLGGKDEISRCVPDFNNAASAAARAAEERSLGYLAAVAYTFKGEAARAKPAAIDFT